jgi:hypothetical protein
MGRSDPASISAVDVQGGTNTTVTVVFNGIMPSNLQDPVSYEGDVDALESNPPTACPWPAYGYGVSETKFEVVTKVVTSIKSVTVCVNGPTCVKKATFSVFP